MAKAKQKLKLKRKPLNEIVDAAFDADELLQAGIRRATDELGSPGVFKSLTALGFACGYAAALKHLHAEWHEIKVDSRPDL
jgi:hypothetical protein